MGATYQEKYECSSQSPSTMTLAQALQRLRAMTRTILVTGDRLRQWLQAQQQGLRSEHCDISTVRSPFGLAPLSGGLRTDRRISNSSLDGS
jgi:hypothetical protein